MNRAITWAALLLFSVAGSTTAATLEGPIPNDASPKGFPFGTAQLANDGSEFDLAAQGYVDQEYFLSGETTRGRIGPYTTRMLVRRPANPKHFNGIVIVEWENVSAQFNIGIDWMMWRKQIVRDGYAMVLVSAQPLGVCSLRNGAPIGGDRIRYAKVTHPWLSDKLTNAAGNPVPLNADGTIPDSALCPRGYFVGDRESDDIFSQAGRAIRANDKKLFGRRLQHMFAAGQSQSSRRLTDYVNDIQPADNVYDLVFLHSGPGLVTNTQTKVFGFNSEAEATEYFEIRNRQPTANYVYWEAAGTAHNPDTPYTSAVMNHSLGLPVPPVACPYGAADPSVNAKRYAGNAALSAIARWLRFGIKPQNGPLMQIDAGAPGNPTDNRTVKDQYGNTVGGVRTPFIDVPTARLIGERNFNSIGLGCFGTLGADPFDGEGPGPALCTTCDPDIWTEPTLQELYYSKHSYRKKILQSVLMLKKQGYLTQEDALEIIKRSNTSDVGGDGWGVSHHSHRTKHTPSHAGH